MIDMKGKTLGRYHLIKPPGEDGIAVVYKAYDAELERNVVIKIIRVGQCYIESFLHRFQREAKALAQLDHPYILSEVNTQHTSTGVGIGRPDDMASEQRLGTTDTRTDI